MEKKSIMDKKELYRHYKGGFYAVITEAKYTEAEGTLVIYMDEKGGIWARPKEMFYGLVEVDGKEIKRFAKCY